MESKIPVYKLFKPLTAIVDALIIYVGVYLALRIKFIGGAETLTEQNLTAIGNVLPFICVIGVVLLYVNGMYNGRARVVFDAVYSIIIVVFLLAVITMALSFFLRSFAFPRSVIAAGSLLQLLLLSAWRVVALYIERALHGKQTVLVVGHNGEIQQAVDKINLSPGSPYEVRHLFDLSHEYKQLRRIIPTVDHVFVCAHISPEERQRIFYYCMERDTSVFMVPDLMDICLKNAQMQPFDDMPVFKLGRLKLTWDQRLVKRLFDICFSVIVIVLTAPIMLIAALLVRLTSSGPILYRQERITENGRVFRILKFRTMINGAEDETGPVLTAEKDQRVTRVGAFLRVSKIDELPQFINVLVGDMSVVGPRPERPFFTDQFNTATLDYEYRATVKAGITGYAQVMGKYTTSFEDKLRYDLMYIKNWNLWLDITLIAQTVRVFGMSVQ